MHKLELSYLASPYTHPDTAVREQRFRAVCKKAAELMARGSVVFSPIAHSHPIDVEFDKPESGEFWKKQDAPYLEFCTELIVFMLDGWEQSKGLAHEIEVAQQRGIPVIYERP